MKKRGFKRTSYLEIIFLTFILCGSFTACSDSRDAKTLKDSLSQLPKYVETEEKKIENIGIYVDATPSMQGFLGMRTDAYRNVIHETRYVDCLNEIDNIIASRYDSKSLTYYRVDTPLWETSENVLKEAQNAGYYSNSELYAEAKAYHMIDLIDDDGSGYDSWCLTNALLNCKDEDLSILITDFYENERATNRVIDALKQNLTLGKTNEKTVGIVGILSEFAGLVYDLLPNGERIEYGIVDGDVTEDDICYRQFYVIVIGFPDEVQDFCNYLKDNMNMDGECINDTVFYENEIYGLDYADFGQCYSRSNEKNDKLWPDVKVLINDSMEFPSYEYYNKTDSWKDIWVSYKASDTLLDQELEGEIFAISLPNGQTVEVLEVPCTIGGQNVSFWNPDEPCYETADSLKDFFQIKAVYFSPQEKELFVQFGLSNEGRRQISLKLNCQVYYDYPQGIRMDWVEDWNLRSNEYDCRKTKGLKEYMNALKGGMPKRNDLLLDFVFYINIP